jgi:hypothetical protein
MGMGTGRSETRSLTKALHVCPECTSQLVQPVAWEQTPKATEWKLWRRCPECEWLGEGVYHETEIDEFDEQLDFGTRELAEELRSLEQANMEQAAQVFVTALQNDLILPEDF